MGCTVRGDKNNRDFLLEGAILLDLEEKDLPGVIYRVVEQMVVEELINQEDKAAVMRLLLLPHKHVQQDHDKFSRFIRRNTSSYTSLTVIFFFFINSLCSKMASEYSLLFWLFFFFSKTFSLMIEK